MKYAFSSAVLSLLWLLAIPSFAASGRADYDLDDDGLIEINDWADLNEIRNSLDGTKLYGVSTGCPTAGCNGFELTADLNFDTNGDKKLDASDTYWNVGNGWLAIGDSGAPFTAIFEGNGHIIRNLMINRTSTYYQGLFGAVQNASIRNLAMTGSLFNIKGYYYTGAVAGYAQSSLFEGCFVAGSVSGYRNTGGLLGYAYTSTQVRASFVSGTISYTNSYRDMGGLVGNTNGGLTLAGSLATAKVSLVSNAYPLVGGYTSHTATDNYFIADTATPKASYYDDGKNGASLAQLQCATTADNTSCKTGTTLYANWGTYKDASGKAYWDIGTNKQLPGLVLNGTTYRDGDGDGAIDVDDAFPASSAASLDGDGDGYPDRWAADCDSACQAASGLTIDYFPSSAAASLDTDFDGKPDAWNASCNSACQTASGLTLDTKLNDRDNDGISDATDTDDNNDGITDADADSDGLIDIVSLVDLDVVRYSPAGAGRKANANSAVDSSGCPVGVVSGVPAATCVGYELLNDLDFDANQDGKIDTSDAYWNSGSGWVPVAAFTGVFEGNGHIIRNLFINRPNIGEIGFFASLNPGAAVRNLVLGGPLLSVTGGAYTGAIAGYMTGAQLSNSAAFGKVKSTTNYHVGGLVGVARENSSLNTLFAAVDVVANATQVGGLLGYIDGTSSLKNSLSVGCVSGISEVGGLLGNDNANISTSYWATDVSTQSAGLATAAVGATLAQLQCPTASDNTSCASGKTLYVGWSALKDPTTGAAYWSFGTNKQLPALVLKGITYRDSDGDGALDGDDAFPSNYAASIDKDGDGFPDRWTAACDSTCQAASGLVLDQFPAAIAASVDGDHDGKPDAWNPACNTTCQLASSLVLDTKLNDVDNDGITDSLDSDNNNDGTPDADSNHNGLIEVATLAQLDAMRFSLGGEGRKLSANAVQDSSGCPQRLVDGAPVNVCYGYELTADLNFDSNGDGKLDVSDSYWDTGKGWMAIGTDDQTPFTGTLEGNGHIIRNLMINRPDTDLQGLFGSIKNATLRNLGLGGSLFSITAASSGGLSARATNSLVEGCFVAGTINTNGSYAGGILGYASGGTVLRAVMSMAVIKPQGTNSTYIGGLVGDGYSTILGSYSTTAITSTLWSYGLQGGTNNSTKITDSYFALNSGNYQVSGTYDGKGVGVSLAQLKCPVKPDDVRCVAGTALYVNWGTYLNASGKAYWDFGTDKQLPGLVLNGVTYRDGDGDGSLDSDDAFPDNMAASVDADKDGVADRWSDACDAACQANSGLKLDQFPNSIAVSVDTDMDGLPDAWNSFCNSVCQTASGLTLDTKPNDTDNDGITNAQDTDDNNDGLPDADADSDGLIEISTWAQLDAVRYNLVGTGRTLSDGGTVDSSGCPAGVVNGSIQQACRGYELTGDLNFDTNNDGKLSALDSYWNNGAGWSPISGFSGTFEGNGYVIKNLTINQPSIGNLGLFAYTDGATMRNLGLTGKLMSITGAYNLGGLVGEMKGGSLTAVYAAANIKSDYSSYSYIGGLVGYAHDGVTITGCYTIGSVSAVAGYVGGLVGYAENLRIQASFSTTSVKGADYVGGLVGYASNSTFDEVYATGAVRARSGNVGGLSGYGDTKLDNAYWAIDATGQKMTYGTATTSSVFDVTLAQLRCPTAINNTSCIADKVLYKAWNTVKNAQGTGYWDFGTNTQLPGLVLNGVIHRDSDGDGVIDADDVWPTQYAAAIDGDGDGAPDKWSAGCDSACQTASGLKLDQFPSKAAASVDTDLDGLPDTWNTSCNSACQTASGLVLDTKPNDSDNDGINNANDKDDNGDGIEDADANSNGLIDIKTLAQLDSVRYNLKGTGRVLTENGTPDSSGCPSVLQDGVLTPVCYGYELLANLNFDTNGDGKLDAADTYWNAGAGWVAIGSGYDSLNNPFASIFEGNGYSILNLMISRPNDDYQGLFGYVNMANVRNLALAGPLTAITGNEYVGAIAGYMVNSRITGSYAMGAIKATDSGSSYVGGLVGEMGGSNRITASFSTGSVESTGYYVGGIVGYSTGDDLLDAVFSSASIKGNYNLGGLAGAGSNLTINASYATGKITATNNNYIGGVVGYSGTSTNSYWATDASGQTNDGSGALGVTLAQLKCPTAADNTTCVSGKTLYEGWADIKDEKGNAYWNFGTSTQLPTLVLNGVVIRDSDNDGIMDGADTDDDNDRVADDLDQMPYSAAASSDTDGDGYPNAWSANCDSTCQTNSGLKLDALPNNPAASVDTDGDGFPDIWNPNCNAVCQAASGLQLDNLPLSAAASVDTDGDGSPNSWNIKCNTACQTSSGLKLDQFPNNNAASVDLDLDGMPDAWSAGCQAECQITSLLVLDQLPNNKAASVDKDGDGSPDSWNLSCDASCKAASGLTLDAFPNNKAAAVDADGDGRPDVWNVSCNSTCQAGSGLTFDTLLNDKDNDGVPDASDTDNTKDNGKPMVLAVPEDINIAATGATTLVTIERADVSAFDAVDKQLDLEVSNGSQKLTLDANSQVALPSGAIKLRWVAIDDAGNRSDAVEQVANVYPQVQFAKKQDVTGEKSNAKLAISFSGAVPVYPVKLTFSWVTSESTAVTADVNTTAETGIDLNKLVLTINNAEELAKAALTIPVLEDALVENDETMTFDIISASAGNESPFNLPIVEANKRTLLTITEKNLAPSVVLNMTQGGKVTSVIDPKAGVVDVTSVVTDLNGKDTHSYVWDTAGLPVSGLDKATYSFDPLKMANGSYNLSLTVTDNGLSPLSSEKVTLKFEVKSQSSSSSSSTSNSTSSSSSSVATETGGGAGSGGGGGGSIDFILLLALCSLGFRFRVAKR